MKFIHYMTDGRERACLSLEHDPSRQYYLQWFDLIKDVEPVEIQQGSRISYMGLLPEYRGQQFGKWIHRHGFEMMRAQGGELYHGGTLIENMSMLRLFHSHACTEYRKMQEWIYR